MNYPLICHGMLKRASYSVTRTHLTLGIGTAWFLVMVGYVLKSFHFKYTDMDQLLMWFGAMEFKSFRIHSLRYIGQDYGSMIEALLAAILPSTSFSKTLPLVSAFLLASPYVLLASVNRKRSALGLILGFLLLLPLEYYLIGFMPRDFVTGIAVTSLAFLFLHKQSKVSNFLIGLLCITGWSIQQNAALLGAVISVSALFSNNRFALRSFLWVSIGYTAGFAVHTIGGLYFEAHPELIVHHTWDFHYAWKQLWDGWKNLDRHFAWIVPIFTGKGWVVLVLFVVLMVWAYNQKKWAVFWSTVALFLLTFLSFGVLKIHDGRDNVFFSHERMFLAIPVAFIFLITQLRLGNGMPSRYHKLAFLLLIPAIGLSMVRVNDLDHLLEFQLDDNRDHVTKVISVDAFEQICQSVYERAEEHGVDWVISSPIADQQGLVMACGCNALFESPVVLDPTYERKTWEMRNLESSSLSRFIWIADVHVDIEEICDGLDFRRLEDIDGKQVWLIQGEDIRPLSLFAKTGFNISNH